jgi:hypothetical protein
MNARKRLELMIRTDRGDMTVWSEGEVRNALDAYAAEVQGSAPPTNAVRRRTDHRATASRLREHPGSWEVVGDYSEVSAAGIASHIRTAFLAAYQPAGAFEAYAEPGENGFRVNARYVGGAP